MNAFKKLLPKTAIGRVMLADSARVLATQGQEVAGNAKLQHARKLLQGDSLPRIESIIGMEVVSNRSMVSDLRVYEVFG